MAEARKNGYVEMGAVHWGGHVDRACIYVYTVDEGAMGVNAIG